MTIEVQGSHDYHHAAAPRFVQELQDEEVEEGESLTIQCRSPHDVSSTGMKFLCISFRIMIIISILHPLCYLPNWLVHVTFLQIALYK